MSTVEGVLKELEGALRVIYGARLRRMVLYGSHARGAARWDSDVDVAVVLDGPVDVHEEIRRTATLVNDLNLRHFVAIALLPVSEDDYLHRMSPLHINLRQEGLPT